MGWGGGLAGWRMKLRRAQLGAKGGGETKGTEGGEGDVGATFGEEVEGGGGKRGGGGEGQEGAGGWVWNLPSWCSAKVCVL